MADYERLNVWRRAHEFALGVYAVTRQYPKDERYALTSQTRRAAASVASNIAEGAGRGSDADFARFVRYAVASANEAAYQLQLAFDLGYMELDRYQALRGEVRRVRSMLSSLRSRLVSDGAESAAGSG